MITEQQIKRVHVLADKLGITDPIKHHAKMGKALVEYLDYKGTLPEFFRPVMGRKMGVMWLYLIMLCEQINYRFHEEYWGHKHYSMEPMPDDVTFQFLSIMNHVRLAGEMLDQNHSKIGRIIRIWLEECMAQKIAEYEALEMVLSEYEKQR